MNPKCQQIKWNFESSFQMRGNHRKWCCVVLYILTQPLQRSARAANHRQTARQKQRAVFRTSAGDTISKQFNKIQSAGLVCPALFVCFSKQRDIPRKWVCTTNEVIRDDGAVSARARLSGVHRLFRDRKHDRESEQD